MIEKKQKMMQGGIKKNQNKTNQKKEVLPNKYGERIQEGSGAAPLRCPHRPAGGAHGPAAAGNAGLHGYGFLSFPLENVSAASPERCDHRNRKRLLLQSSSGLDIMLRIWCKQVGRRAVCNRRRWDGYQKALSP